MRRHSLTILSEDRPLTPDDALRASLIAVLGLDAARVARFDDETLLFGALPELDSMAVGDAAHRFSRIASAFASTTRIVDAESFESFGALRDMLARKLGQRAG